MNSSDLSLESKVAFLRQPSSYTDATYRVEAIETHMSWVFLTENFAYKLKKPVQYDFLDFSSPEARRHFCEEEVRLNRRLAPDVYLGVVALGIDAHGHLQFDENNAIDWLVKMRRLPRGRMLDHMIRRGIVGFNEIAAVANVLCRFYASCEAVQMQSDKYRDGFLRLIQSNENELLAPAFQLPEEKIRSICTAQREFSIKNFAMFDERVRAGKIVEGHGDLRPEHVCLQSQVSIIDCLEFSFELRVVDRADEVAFLALECERFGAPNQGAFLLQRYGELSGDHPPRELVHFFQSVRASVRAAIAIRHLNEEKYRYSAVWRQRALDYLQLAQAHAALMLPSTR